MKTALVGWRGMVGTVLLQRMVEENDFDVVDVDFFSTSQAGAAAPRGDGLVQDAGDIALLSDYAAIVTCQGGAFTQATYNKLRESGWNGLWIDAASTLRMEDDCVIVLDPVNRSRVDEALGQGVRTFAGGNCTVSLLLMAILPLLERDWVRRVTSMTYQAVSGAGAAAVLEMVAQTRQQARAVAAVEAGATAMELAELMQDTLAAPGLADQLGVPIASNLIPWIDAEMADGRSREEWKGAAESNKILGRSGSADSRGLIVDGLCVRVPVFRCHSQALSIELEEDVPLSEIESALQAGHRWLDCVPNDRDSTLARLTPSAVTGSLTIAVGRLRNVLGRSDAVTLFTVGDQLLWGAAEPLRRMLRIAAERASELDLCPSA